MLYPIKLYIDITTSRSLALSTCVLFISLIKSVNRAQFLNVTCLLRLLPAQQQLWFLSQVCIHHSNYTNVLFLYATYYLITRVISILSSISSGWEFWSVNNTSIYEKSELYIFKNLKYFSKMSYNWLIDLFETNKCIQDFWILLINYNKLLLPH